MWGKGLNVFEGGEVDGWEIAEEALGAMMADQLTFGSLFAGIGGFDLGFERAGVTCKWQVEIDEYATRVLERHWPRVRRWRDVREFIGEVEQTWLDNSHYSTRGAKRNPLQVDVICGGFP